MTGYELTVVVDAKKSQAAAKKLFDGVALAVTALGGKVAAEALWGERDLAYPIGKISTGNYNFYELELEGSRVSDLKKRLEGEESIIRYLLVRNGKKLKQGSAHR